MDANNSYKSPDLEFEDYSNLQLDLSSLKSEKVFSGFIEATAIDLAIHADGKESKFTGQVVRGDKGVDQIIAPGDGSKQIIFNATSTVEFDNERSTTTIDADLNVGNQFARQVEVTLTPAHSENVKVRDANDASVIETQGGCSPREGHPDRCDFTVSNANKVLAVIEGTRSWLSGDHTQTHYNLFSPDQPNKKFASVDIDRSVENGIVTMNLEINKKSPEH